MSNKKIDFNLIITIVIMLVTIGTTWGIAQTKLAEIGDVKKKADNTELKVVAVETKLEDIKEAIQEQKSDTKAILKLLMEKYR